MLSLFEPFPFFASYDVYIRITVRAAYHEQFLQWKGWVENQACVDARDAKGENGNAMDAKGENDNACDFFIGVCVNERAKRAGALNLSRAANSFIDILRV